MSNIMNFSAQSSTSNEIANTIFITEQRDSGGIGVGHQGVSALDNLNDMIVVPAVGSLNSPGMPLLQRAQQFYSPSAQDRVQHARQARTCETPGMVEAGRKDARDAASSSVVVVGGGAAEASGGAIVADTDSYSALMWTAATTRKGELR